MSEGDTQRDPLEELAAEFVERQRTGQGPTIAEYAERYPDLADEIRDLFPTIIAMEKLKARSERSADGLATLGPVTLERLGDFHIIREIGRGGMGIVYEAEQESLGRRVAVKVLPRQALLEARHLARFKREARIAAGLHHTNIVQVFGVGESEGFHYYAMQLVQGIALDRIIGALASQMRPESGEPGSGRDRQSDAELCNKLLGQWGSGEYWRRVAKVGLQVAQALSYAHAHGAVHRDVKPANLLVDVRGTVWVADFGLARSIESPDVTQGGEVTGTLRYMAPEQFDGRPDARSDIYGLGMTLYELLTLRVGYDDTDRSSLIRRIAQEPPPRPRKIASGIPRDLETIVLTALARNPAHRYSSAELMAGDLQRFCDDRPIEARRISVPERLWRWCRRNRAVAALTAVSLLLLVTTAVVSTVGYLQTKDAFEGESRQRARSEALSAVAREALDRIFDRLGPIRTIHVSDVRLEGADGANIEMPHEPVLSDQAAGLLEEMLPFYDRLAEQAGDDAGIRLRAADANRRVGDIRHRLGRYDRAVAAYGRALSMYAELDDHRHSETDFSTQIAEIHNEVGRVHRTTRRAEQSRDAHLQALAILQPSASDAAPLSAQKRYELARTHYFLGTRAQPEPGAKPRGPKANERSPRGPRRDWPGQRQPPPRRTRPDKTEQDKVAAATRREHLAKAIALLDALTKEFPGQSAYRRMLAVCYRDGYREVAAVLRIDAEEVLKRAIVILEQLTRDFPDVADYRFDLCETYAVVDRRDPSLSRMTFPTVRGRLDKALAISEKLVATHPHVPQYLVSQAHIHHSLGSVLRKMHQLDEAETSDRRAVTILASLAKRYPKVLSHQVYLGAYRNSLTDLLLRRDKHSEARVLLSRTIVDLEAFLSRNPEMRFLHTLLADSNRTLAAVLRRTGQPDQAQKAARREQEHRNAAEDASQRPASAAPTRG